MNTEVLTGYFLLGNIYKILLQICRAFMASLSYNINTSSQLVRIIADCLCARGLVAEERIAWFLIYILNCYTYSSLKSFKELL